MYIDTFSKRMSGAMFSARYSKLWWGIAPQQSLLSNASAVSYSGGNCGTGSTDASAGDDGTETPAATSAASADSLKAASLHGSATAVGWSEDSMWQRAQRSPCSASPLMSAPPAERW